MVHTRRNLNQTTVTTRRSVDKFQSTANGLQRCLRQETSYIRGVTTVGNVYITDDSGCSWAVGLTNSNSTPTAAIINLVDLVTRRSAKPLFTYLCSARWGYASVDNDIVPCSKCSSSSDLIIFISPSTRISTCSYNIIRLNAIKINCTSTNAKRCLTTRGSLSQTRVSDKNVVSDCIINLIINSSSGCDGVIIVSPRFSASDSFSQLVLETSIHCSSSCNLCVTARPSIS